MPDPHSVAPFLRLDNRRLWRLRCSRAWRACSVTDRSRGGVVDAHHHVWDLNVRPQPWLAEEGLELLRRSFDMTDLADDAADGVFGRPLHATVLVQCLPSVAETEEFLSLAAATHLIAGVVGWVDLTDPDVGSELDRLARLPGGDWLVGIRHLVQAEPDPMWLMRDDVCRGLGCGRHSRSQFRPPGAAAPTEGSSGVGRADAAAIPGPRPRRQAAVARRRSWRLGRGRPCPCGVAPGDLQVLWAGHRGRSPPLDRRRFAAGGRCAPRLLRAAAAHVRLGLAGVRCRRWLGDLGCRS